RAASLVGKETHFPRLPAGKWWVYLFGVYVYNKKPVGNFLSEKRVRVRRSAEEIAQFNLIPEETSVTIRVTSRKEPIFGAAVWLDGHEHQAIYTNKMASGALLMVPRGEHTI